MQVNLKIDDLDWFVAIPPDATGHGKLTWRDNRPGIWCEFENKKPKFIRARQSKYGSKKTGNN